MRDDRLRLIFTCCHPALAPSAQVALTLRLLGGLTHRRDRPRLPRAGADDGAAARPGQEQDPRRRHPLPGARATPTCPTGCAAVLAVRLPDLQRGLHGAAPATHLIRDDLCAEAIRLGRLLVELMPDEPEALGLLALMLLTESRRAGPDDAPTATWCCSPTRTAPRWDRDADRRGPGAGPRCLRRDRPGPVPDPGRDRRRAQRRADAPPTPTGRQIVALYDQLTGGRAQPGRRAQPRGRRGRGRRPGGRRWPLVDGLDLDGYHLFHAVRADLLGRARPRRRGRRGVPDGPSP